MNDAVDWARDLGGGVRVAPRPGGHVPVRMPGRCSVPCRASSGIASSPTRSMRRTGSSRPSTACSSRRRPARPGRDRDRRTAGREDPDDARLRGPWIVRPSRPLASAPSVNVVAMSHLHYDHAGGLLRRTASAPSRTHDRRPTGRMGDRPRRQSAARRQLRPARAAARREVGCRGLGRGREGAAARRDRCPHGGHSAGHQAIVVAGRPAPTARLLRRPVHAAVGRQPALGDRVRRLPPDSVSVKADLFAQAADEDWIVVLSHERDQPSGGWSVIATGSATRRTEERTDR